LNHIPHDNLFEDPEKKRLYPCCNGSFTSKILESQNTGLLPIDCA